MEEQSISIGEIVNSLKKRWKMILIITLCATVLSGVISFFVITPQYEAGTKVFIGKEEGSVEGYSQSDVIMYQRLMKTYSEAIKTKSLVGKALEKVNTEQTVEQALGALTVSNVPDTQILEIKFKGSDPVEARNIVAAVTEEFIVKAKQMVSNGNVKVVEQVITPENPVSPNKVMNIMIAFLLGIMVSVGLCFLLEFMDNTFKNSEALEQSLDIPVLGVIPFVEVDK